MRGLCRLAILQTLTVMVAANLAWGQGKFEGPRESRVPVLGARVRELAAVGERVRVLVVLTVQPHRQIVERQREGVRGRMAALEANGSRAAWNDLESATRRVAAQEIGIAIGPSQAELETAVSRAGGRILERHQAINMLTVELPTASLDVVAQHPLVAEILPLVTHSAQLQTSVPALGAPTFWNGGFAGQGQSLAVLDTGVKTNHPAFAGLTVSNHIFLSNGLQDSCFGDDAQSAQDLQGHGTHVAGIMASRGSTECLNCKGVAKELGTLYNVKIGYLIKNANGCTSPGGGSANSGDVYAAIGWLAQNTPVRILNYSYGGGASTDDDSNARMMDQLADAYGLLPVIAAGNSGPNATTVNTPGIGYNGITVANWSDRGTIYNSSSRGATFGGRKKPDVAAPGTSILSAAHNWDDSGAPDYVTRTGTSMATPHIAGAAALLTAAGVNDPLAIKAILLNTTDAPGWAADAGWGYANLNKAWNGLFYQTGSLTARPAAGYYKLYRLQAGAAARATVVWNRHIVNGATSVFHDIDLLSYGTASNTAGPAGESEKDNVEQVALSSAGDYVVKVRMFSTSLGGGITGERYAVAFSESGATPVAGPVLSVSCAPVASVVVSTGFQLRCTATNNGDLPAFGASGSVTLPSGFGGTTALQFGTIAASGGTQSATLNLTAPLTAGSYSSSATISSSSYEETFSTSANFTIPVDPAAPGSPVGLSPANGATGVGVNTSLAWVAVSGAASYDIYFGPSSSPVFAGNTTGTQWPLGVLQGETTYYWRVVAKNVTGSASTGVQSFTTGVVLTPPGLPSPASGASGVLTTPALSWSGAGTSGVSYDLYLGTAPAPPLAVSGIGTSFTLSNLAGGTTYYWQVVAKKGGVTAASPVWTFTTVPKAYGLNPPVLVSSNPASVTGSPQTFQFTLRDFDGFDNVDRIYFLVNGDPTIPKNTCHGILQRQGSVISLYNDELTAFASGLENSQCAVASASSGIVSGSGSDLAARLTFSLKGTFSGTQKNVYIWAVDAQNNGTGWLPISTWAATNLNRPPVLSQASVPTVTGSPQTFSFAASDPDGYSNIARIFFLVNDSAVIPQNGCHGFYERSQNSFYLYNDALTSLNTQTGGSAGTLQNGQCSIDGGLSGFVSGSGTDLSVRMTMALRGSYAGTAKKVYLWIVDNEGNGTGWVPAANWGAANQNRPPSVSSWAPATAVGSPQTFTFIARDPDGFANLRLVYFLINGTATIPQNTCHGLFDRVTNQFYLYNDALTALAPTLENSQCAISAGSSGVVSASGTDLSLRLTVSLKGSFAGTSKNSYLWAVDAEGNGTGWVQMGSWPATAVDPNPVVVTSSPATATGSPQTLSVTGRSPAGFANINRIYFLVNGSATIPTNSCHGFYDRATNQLGLFNDSLTSITVLTPGTSTVQNSQCIVQGAGTTVTGSGTDLTLTVAMSLAGSYGNTGQNVYFLVQDVQGRNTGWVKTTAWAPAVANQPPAVVSGSPTSASGPTQTFTVTGRDSNGFSDIRRIYFEVNTNPSVAVNTCHGFYDRATNGFYLFDASLTTVLGPLAPGATGSLDAGVCALQGQGSTVNGSGTDVVLSLALTKKGTLAATGQRLYVWLVDAAGTGTGWVQVSNWN